MDSLIYDRIRRTLLPLGCVVAQVSAVAVAPLSISLGAIAAGLVANKLIKEAQELARCYELQATDDSPEELLRYLHRSDHAIIGFYAKDGKLRQTVIADYHLKNAKEMLKRIQQAQSKADEGAVTFCGLPPK